MKKRSLAAFVLATTMVFSSAAVYAADVSPASIIEDEVTRSISSGTITMARTSALNAIVELSAESTMGHLDYIKATITVERYGSNGWTQYYAPYDVYGDAEVGGLLVDEYVSVKVSGTYRVKVVFSDKKGSVTSSTSAKYSRSVDL